MVTFNNGATNTVTSPINDRVQVSNNTTVNFNAGGDVDATGWNNGLATTTTTAITVLDTSRVNINVASITGFISSGGSSTNTATGLSAAGSAIISVHGGSITGSISAGGGCTDTATGLLATNTANVSIYGGILKALVSAGGGGTEKARAVTAAGSSVVSIYGGSFLASGGYASNLDLLVQDNAVVTLFGSGFNLPLGPVSPTSGTITGSLQSGEQLDLQFSQTRAGQIVLVPEPGTLALAGLALLGLIRSNRRSVRGSALDVAGERR